MIVDISSILKVNNEKVDFSISENIENTGNYPDVCGFLSPVKVEGTITNLDGIFEVRGEGSVFAQINCGRCLGPVDVEVSFEVNEDFSLTGSKNEEIETFSGYTIDLSSVVARSLLVGLPMRVLCDNDCRGLCPICGRDLNKGDCKCDTSVIDPRFESLRSLFKLDGEV